jgi:hypothetical protein
MIAFLSGFADNVVAVDCTGTITRADYVDVLIPAVESKLKAHKSVRLYYRAGQEFAGIDSSAILEDARVGLSHFSQWGQVAIVTDIEWLRVTAKAFGFLMPCPVRCFHLREEELARWWISS